MRKSMLRWLLTRSKTKPLYQTVAWRDFDYLMHAAIALDMVDVLREAPEPLLITRPLFAMYMDAPTQCAAPAPWQAQTALVVATAIDRYATQPIPV